MKKSPADEAFTDFFKREYRFVRRNVLLVTGNNDVADDLTQEAFLQLLTEWPKVCNYERPEAWVRRVAIRIAVRWKRRQTVQLKALRLLGINGMAEVPEWAVGNELFEAMRALSARQRAAMVLHYVEDHPLDEIADLLGCSTSTAKVHLHRARRRLAAMVREGNSDEH